MALYMKPKMPTPRIQVVVCKECNAKLSSVNFQCGLCCKCKKRQTAASWLYKAYRTAHPDAPIRKSKHFYERECDRIALNFKSLPFA